MKSWKIKNVHPRPKIWTLLSKQSVWDWLQHFRPGEQYTTQVHCFLVRSRKALQYLLPYWGWLIWVCFQNQSTNSNFQSYVSWRLNDNIQIYSLTKFRKSVWARQTPQASVWQYSMFRMFLRNIMKPSSVSFALTKIAVFQSTARNGIYMENFNIKFWTSNNFKWIPYWTNI